MGYELNIQIDELFQDRVDEAWLRRAVEETLTAEGVDPYVELDLVITDDKTVHELNQRYRGVDEITDVLAFAFLEENFVTPPLSKVHLGEVVISYPQALRQAEVQRHSLERELALLAIQGVLHLLSYDDEDPENEEKMRAIETKILSALNNFSKSKD